MEASGSCLRYGLGVTLHTDAASSQRRAAEGRACCLFTGLLPSLVIYFISSPVLLPHHLCTIMSAQIRQL